MNSEPAPPGTLVTFTIAGDTYTTTTPAEKDYGISWYWIQIVPPAGTNYTGQPAYIEVNGLPVHVATWEVGGNQVIHLSVPISAGASSQGMANPAAVTSNVALPGWSDDPPPALPSRFRGLVTVNGQPAPDGTTVTIEVGGEIYQTTTPSIYGPSTYFNQVVPPEGEDFIGDIVYFAVNGVPVKAVTWEPGGNTQVDLQT
ncbi:MAG: hypothetical protein IBX68_05640 [Dehalococcoidia bacterium]|nr:hypothetical protein [Dehalococcoidia bacterium]